VANIEWDLRAWSKQDVRFRVTIDPASLLGTVSPFGATLLIPYDILEPTNGYTLDPVLISLGGFLRTDASAGMDGLVIPQQPVYVNQKRLVVNLDPIQLALLEDFRAGATLSSSLS